MQHSFFVLLWPAVVLSGITLSAVHLYVSCPDTLKKSVFILCETEHFLIMTDNPSFVLRILLYQVR